MIHTIRTAGARRRHRDKVKSIKIQIAVKEAQDAWLKEYSKSIFEHILADPVPEPPRHWNPLAWIRSLFKLPS